MWTQRIEKRSFTFINSVPSQAAVAKIMCYGGRRRRIFYVRSRFACAILAFLKDEFKTTRATTKQQGLTLTHVYARAAHYNEIKSLKVQVRALRLVCVWLKVATYSMEGSVNYLEPFKKCIFKIFRNIQKILKIFETIKK